MVTQKSSKLLGKLGYIAFVFLSTLLSIFPPPGPVFRWWEYYALHWMLTLFGLGLVWFIFNQPRLMLASFAACAILCLHLDPQPGTFRPGAHPGAPPLIKVAHFSLAKAGESVDSIIHLILHSGADLISVRENLPPADREQMREILTLCGYLHQDQVDTGDDHRLSLFSRLPFARSRSTGRSYGQSLSGQLLLNYGSVQYTVHFICVSLKQAEDEAAFADLRQELDLLARQARRVQAPLLVFGHYNLVSWSRELRGFQLRAELRDSRRGLTPSHPHGYLPLWDLPVDHLFFNDHLKCVNFTEISSFQNDHLGVVGTFELTKQGISDDQRPSQKL